ncbi:Glycoside hydrolase, family 28, partial [Cynara cardunculus var. scolymus]
ANCIKLVITCILTIISISQSQPITSEIDVTAFGAIGDGITDDKLALQDAWNVACSSTGNLMLPSGNFLVGPTTFRGPCKPKTMVVNVIGTVKAIPRKDWNNEADTWLNFEHVENLIITGPGQFEGQGDSGWWDCEKTNNCETNPTALGFHHCNGVKLIKVTSKNSPKNHISINACDGAIVDNVTLIAPKESPNTDGIDISATNGVHVNGGTIQTGDDCIAINGGSSNIHIDGLFCGPGHGVSVGSLGRNGKTDIVRNVTVINTTFTATQNGARVKTVPGGSGLADDITFSNITMVAVENPIILTQFYCPHKQCNDIPPVVHVSDVTFKDIHGTSSKPDAINILCSKSPESCTGITLEQINIGAANLAQRVVSNCHNTRVQTIGVVSPPIICTINI